MEDLLDALPFVVLAVLLAAATTLLTRKDNSGPREPLRVRHARARVQSMVVVIGVVVIAPSVGIGIGTALSLSQSAEGQLAVGIELATLIVALLWRKRWLRRRIG